MAGQTLQTNIVINAQTGNGFSRAGATLTELGSLVDGLSQRLIGFGEDSIRVYRDYEKSMASAETALSTTYGQGTQELSSVMGKLDSAATEWAATTIFHTNDVGNAISEAAHAGWDLDQIMSGIPAAMQLAQAGSLDLSEAVNYIVKSTTAAGISFEDMGKWIDLWTYAANSSATDIGEFGDAILKMGSTVRFAADPEELMTLIAVTANAGAVGSEAGTMIRNSMIRLIAPTDKARAAMDELGATSEEYAEVLADDKLMEADARLAAVGFSAYDESGQLKSIIDTYRDLYVALGEVAGGYENIEGNEDALRILTAIFPTRNTTEALNLLRAIQDGSVDLYDALKSGAANDYGAYAAETMMDTLDGKIETFLSKVERLKQLTGEELSGQLEAVLGLLGRGADWISGLDDGKFSMLVQGLEGIAFVGPGLLIAGGALRFIGMLSNPIALAAVSVTALAAGFGALDAYSDMEFENNFGEMALDMGALKESIAGITTSADSDLAPIRELSSQLQQLQTDYSETVTAFSTDLSTAVLTGATLDETAIGALREQGEAIHGYVIEGINLAKEKSLGMLNIVSPEEGEFTPEEASAYNNMYGWLTDYYGGLEEEATGVGERINDALEKALNGEINTQELYEQIQAAFREYDRVTAEFQERQDRQANLAALEKAHQVSFESMDEYMTELGSAYEQDTQQLADDLAVESSKAWDAANQAAEKEGRKPLSWEEWHNSPEYKELYGKYQTEKQAELDSIYGERAMAAFDTLMEGSGYSGNWEILKQINGAARDESGNLDYRNINLADYMAPGDMQDFIASLKSLSRFGEWSGMPGMGQVDQILQTANVISSTYAGVVQSGSLSTNYIAPAEPLMPGIVQDAGMSVDVDVNGNIAPLTSAIDTQDNRAIDVDVSGNTDPLNSAISQAGNRTVYVNVRPRNSFTGNLNPTFAEGGRADVASIFGEAGPEWAIPEEHSARTADLLQAAAQASGFTWPELIARSGGLNADSGHTPSTLVYSPTIYVQDAEGVEEALQADKQRLERWYRERQMHDEAEVYQ